VTFSVVALVAYRFMLHGSDDSERSANQATPRRDAAGSRSAASVAATVRRAGTRTLAVLGVLAGFAALVEDSGASWGALYLRDIGASAATAGLAFVAFQAAMTVGRLTGDRATDRFGQRVVVRTGGLLAAAGMGAALTVPSTASTLVGYAFAGIGVSTLIPAAMHAADELPGLAAGRGLSVVSWLLRVGFLVSAPIVGVIADATSLRVGLVTVVVAGVVIIALSRVFPARPRRASHAP
jgi:MFS family permease